MRQENENALRWYLLLEESYARTIDDLRHYEPDSPEYREYQGSMLELYKVSKHAFRQVEFTRDEVRAIEDFPLGESIRCDGEMWVYDSSSVRDEGPNTIFCDKMEGGFLRMNEGHVLTEF